MSNALQPHYLSDAGEPKVSRLERLAIGYWSANSLGLFNVTVPAGAAAQTPVMDWRGMTAACMYLSATVNVNFQIDLAYNDPANPLLVIKYLANVVTSNLTIGFGFGANFGKPFFFGNVDTPGLRPTDEFGLVQIVINNTDAVNDTNIWCYILTEAR